MVSSSSIRTRASGLIWPNLSSRYRTPPPPSTYSNLNVLICRLEVWMTSWSWLLLSQQQPLHASLLLPFFPLSISFDRSIKSFVPSFQLNNIFDVHNLASSYLILFHDRLYEICIIFVYKLNSAFIHQFHHFNRGVIGWITSYRIWRECRIFPIFFRQ